MKHFYSFLTLMLLGLLSFSAQAGQATLIFNKADRFIVKIDDEVKQFQDGENVFTWAENTYPQLYVESKEGYIFKQWSYSYDGEMWYPNTLWENSVNTPLAYFENATLKFSALLEDEYYDSAITVDVDNPEKAHVELAGKKIKLEKGVNTIRFNADNESNSIRVCSFSYQYFFYKVEVNDTPVDVSYFCVDLYNMKDGDKVKVYADYPDKDVKISFSFVNPGTETFISDLAVNEQPMPASAVKDGFTIKMGDLLTFGPNVDYYDYNSSTYLKINGETAELYGSFSKQVMEDTEFTVEAVPVEVFTKKITVENADGFYLKFGYATSPNNIPLHDGENFVEFTAKKKEISISLRPLSEITEWTDGGANVLDSYNINSSWDTYVVASEGDMVIKCKVPLRDKKFAFYTDDRLRSYYIGLSAAGYMNYLDAGFTVMPYCDEEIPFTIGQGKQDQEVYVDGQAVDFDSNKYAYTLDVTDGCVVRVYLKDAAKKANVTLDNQAGEAIASVTRDHVVPVTDFSAATELLLPAHFKVVPAEGKTVLAKINGEFLFPAEDGTIEFEIAEEGDVTVTLVEKPDFSVRPETAVLFVNKAASTVSVFNQYADEFKYFNGFTVWKFHTDELPFTTSALETENHEVYVNGEAMPAAEDGVYTLNPVKGDVIRMYLEGPAPKATLTIDNKAPEAVATITRDMILTVTEFGEPEQVLTPSPVIIEPVAGKTLYVSVNGAKIEPSEEGIFGFVVNEDTLVELTDDTVGIENLLVEEAADTDVYNLHGVKVAENGNLDNLPAGIYVTAGKKVVKK